MQKTAETKLVNFLSGINKEHIDELIDILTDYGNGRVALNSYVKDILLFERASSTAKNYSKELIELIITEFQLFSGNSLVNQFRSDLVSYEEILNDVCRAIVINNSWSIEGKEKSILHKILGSEWDSFDFKKRMEKTTGFALLVKANLNANLNANLGLGGVNLGWKVALVNNLFNAAYALKNAKTPSPSTEAYRIMIPFILQISWLKIKYGFYKNNGIAIMEEHKPIKVDKTRKVDSENISTLNQLVGLVPDLLIKRELAQNNIAVLDIPLELLKEAKDGNGLRGMVMGKKGILKNVKIFEPEKLLNLVNTGMLMNLASTVVAQKHLADINQKLTEINESLDSIKNLLLEERHSKIRSAYKDANKAYGCLSKGEDIELNSIYLHLTNVKQVYEQIKLEITRIRNKMRDSRGMDVKKIVDLFKDLNWSCDELKLCCNTIMAINSVCFMKSKLRCYHSDMKDAYEETSDFLNELESCVSEFLDKFLKESESMFNFNSTELSNLAFVKNRKFCFESKTSSSIKELESFSNIFLEDKSLEVYVELENGKIKEAYF